MKTFEQFQSEQVAAMLATSEAAQITDAGFAPEFQGGNIWHWQKALANGDLLIVSESEELDGVWQCARFTADMDTIACSDDQDLAATLAWAAACEVQP